MPFLKPLSRVAYKYIYHENLPEQTWKLEGCLPTTAHNFHTLPTSSMGRNWQHASLMQPFLTNLISPSLTRPCCLAFLRQLHRSRRPLQSLHQSKNCGASASATQSSIWNFVPGYRKYISQRWVYRKYISQHWVHRDGCFPELLEWAWCLLLIEEQSEPHIFSNVHPAGKLQLTDLFTLCNIKW